MACQLGPSTLAGSERVGSMRVLGVEVGASLSVGAHLNVILSNSASSIHVRNPWAPLQQQLQEVSRATTIASPPYASLVWWSFTTIRDRERLDRLMRRLRRAGYLLDDTPSFAKMLKSSEKRCLH